MKTKSIVLSAIAALAISGATSVNTAQAQSSVGYWTLYPQYNNTSVTTPIDTGDKLFYLAMNRLHSYDKVNNESYSYDTSNKLNDNKIINMFYFPEIGSLLIAYDTGNLDLLEIKTDKVVNMSDIADANINYNKDITPPARAPRRLTRPYVPLTSSTTPSRARHRRRSCTTSSGNAP